MEATSNHIGLITRNPKKLIDYYTSVLGFEEGDSRILEPELMEAIFGIPAEGKMTKLSFGKVVLEIFSCEADLKDRDIFGCGYNHWGLLVEDKEAFIKEKEAAGAYVAKIKNKDRFIYFLKDPDENLIEVFEVR
ncbi:MAG: VOC family protein [Candidatus Aminicenantes bacterium]|nr:VOC family protein [Candidatus Aminicenantes bacterium]